MSPRIFEKPHKPESGAFGLSIPRGNVTVILHPDEASCTPVKNAKVHENQLF